MADLTLILLPSEVLLKILSYLSHEDLVMISKVNARINDIVSEKLLIRLIDLRNSYRVTQDDFQEFFSPALRCQNIHHIYLDNLYWIRLPSIVVRMKNLVSLHMLGTNLTFLQLKWLLTSCKKLENLSITWPEDMKTCNRAQWVGGLTEIKQTLAALISLRVLVITDPQPLLALLHYCEKLQSLFIVNHHARGFGNTPWQCCPFRDSPFSLNKLQELIFDHADGAYAPYLTTQVFLNILENCCSANDWQTYWANIQHQFHNDFLERPGGEVLSKCHRLFLVLTPPMVDTLANAGTLHQLKTLCVSGMNPRKVSLTGVIRACPELTALHVLFGLNLSLDIRRTFDLFPKLEQLSLCCCPYQGPPKVVEGIACFTYLTYLSVPTCALIETLEETQDSVQPEGLFTNGFKRQRIGMRRPRCNADVAAFNLVFSSCPKIRILEIGFSDGVSCSPASVHWECLQNICKLKDLTKLTLDGIPITSGCFFEAIFVGCQKLKFLRLRNLGCMSKCCYDTELAQSLPFCQALQHFRLEQPYLAPATILLQAIAKCHLLQRLYIHSERDSYPLDLPALELLVEMAISLVFVYVVCPSTKKEDCARLTRTWKRNSSRPALVARIRQIVWDVFDDRNVENRTVPACHFNEMITHRKWAFQLYANYD